MKERKKVAFHNLGCKVNSYETDAMQQLLSEQGYEIVPFETQADIYIVNTCTVTNMADRKSRQMLHKARKMNPQAVVVATGCYVQMSENQAREDDGVDIIIGNNRKQEIVNILQEYQPGEKLVVHSEINEKHTPYEMLQISRTGEHTRAYIKIQDGCNQFCSYCIIPFARGRVRSRAMEEIVTEVRQLVKNGYQEVVLTGIHVSSYGTDFEEETKKGEHLLCLMQRLEQIEGLKRIRLGSLEPMIMTEWFVEEISKLDKLCPHFHLSLQSGCDETLKRMNRHYTTADYEATCERLRRHFEHPAITTDIITGFPGETEEEFDRTVEFVKQIHFYETHVFKYSKRQGTRAAVMEQQVDEQIKTERSAVLLQLNKQRSVEFREYYMGKEIEVLMEEDYEQDGIHYQTGHTKEYVKAAVCTEETLSNRLVRGTANTFLNKDILLLKN